MTPPLAIPSKSRAVAASISPASSQTLHDRLHKRDSITAIRQPKVLHPVDNEDLKLLILENISQDAVRAFQAQGFHVDHYKKALSEDELVDKISQYHAIGIRSKTKITERVIKAAHKVRPFIPPIQATSEPPSSASCNWLFLYWNESG
jgi:D-3-phosphoglycerate dehydrogenase